MKLSKKNELEWIRVYVLPGRSSVGLACRYGYTLYSETRGMMVLHDDRCVLGWANHELMKVSFWNPGSLWSWLVNTPR